MAHPVLERLKSDEFVLKYAVISNPTAVYRALQQSEEVDKLREGLEAHHITDAAVRQVTEGLIQECTSGQRFADELALAAVAVALETRQSHFAEEYVSDLASLDLAEMAVAIRVARRAWQTRH